MISEAEDDATRDAVMIAAAQKVEHYEIASYGTIRTWATLLGKDRRRRGSRTSTLRDEWGSVSPVPMSLHVTSVV
jgi:ferritin-like metal-binding protein YciE